MSSSDFPIRTIALILSAGALLVSGCDSGSSNSADDGPGAAAEAPAANGSNRDSATPAVNPDQPDVPVIAERLPYAEVDDQLVYGHFVFPADMVDPLPAVILLHEARGLTDNIRARADRLAGEGFIVLAIDLFGGSLAANAEEARLQMVSVVENPDSARENIRQAYSFVRDTAGAPRVGSLGWDFGGGWSLNTAMLFPDSLDAAVIVYGQVSNDPDALGPVTAPILGLFAGQDRSIPAASVRSFEDALESLGKNYEIHTYPDADHDFADPSSRSYQQSVAEDAWQRILDFLNLHLRINGSESA